jgi:hypothetical protein
MRCMRIIRLDNEALAVRWYRRVGHEFGLVGSTRFVFASREVKIDSVIVSLYD